MITVNANASTLCPKTKPEDMEKLKELYRFLDSQLAGLESKMEELGCEKLVITVDTAESNGKEQK